MYASSDHVGQLNQHVLSRINQSAIIHYSYFVGIKLASQITQKVSPKNAIPAAINLYSRILYPSAAVF